MPTVERKNAAKKERKMQALVIVSSRTGNTRIVAHAAADALGAPMVTTQKYLADPNAYRTADPVLLGFWNDRGMAPEDIQAVAQTLVGKRLGLFATMGGDPASPRARAWMEKVSVELAALGRENTIVTTWLGRGRIDPALFERMTAAMGGAVSPEREERRKAAETHPDRLDCLAVAEHFTSAFVKEAK